MANRNRCYQYKDSMKMTDPQKNALLKVARETIAAAISEKRVAKPATDDDDLKKEQGCFVTIKNGQRLRGCIGQFIADKPLIEMVSEMAVLASTRDSRFFDSPITEDELDELDIEISVLSELKKTDDPLSLRLGIDGIYIVKGYASGCFLPQVATETGWSKEEFLSNCCEHKAGIRADAWKKKDVEVYLFTCDVFGKPMRDIK